MSTNKTKKKLILPPIYPYKGNLSKKLESLRHEKEYHKIFFNKGGLKRKLDRTKFNIIQAGFEKDEDDIKNQNEGRKKIMNSYNFNKKLDEFERFVNENCNEEEDYKENESHYSTESEKLKKEEEFLRKNKYFYTKKKPLYKTNNLNMDNTLTNKTKTYNTNLKEK